MAVVELEAPGETPGCKLLSGAASASLGAFKDEF